MPDDLAPVEADPRRLAQAIGNLVSNAIKFTPSGGKVTITAGQSDGEVWIRVSDTGPGMSEEELNRIFTPFYRSQRDRRFPQGMGLGLSIARDLAIAHGGRLEVDSTPGIGSRFTLWIPVASSAAVGNAAVSLS
jgi:signal transduction histidine kinase